MCFIIILLVFASFNENPYAKPLFWEPAIWFCRDCFCLVFTKSLIRRAVPLWDGRILIVRPWLKELAIFDLKIEFCMQKSSPGSLPEVWKREICLNYKIMF